MLDSCPGWDWYRNLLNLNVSEGCIYFLPTLQADIPSERKLSASAIAAAKSGQRVSNQRVTRGQHERPWRNLIRHLRLFGKQRILEPVCVENVRPSVLEAEWCRWNPLYAIVWQPLLWIPSTSWQKRGMEYVGPVCDRPPSGVCPASFAKPARIIRASCTHFLI
jgi:hypothetical protein